MKLLFWLATGAFVGAFIGLWLFQQLPPYSHLLAIAFAVMVASAALTLYFVTMR